MQQINIKALSSEWAKREKEKIEENGKRKYLHFDARIKSVGKRLVEEVTNPDYVVGRFFYPFVQDTQVIRKYKNNNGSKYVAPKDRPICYASHKDAFIFSWYGFLLNSIYEQRIKQLGIDSNVIAYRTDLHRNNIHFAKEVFDFVGAKGDCAVLCFDIEKFFDTLDHKILKSAWRDLLVGTSLDNGGLPEDHYAVLKAATNFSFSVKKNLYKFFGIDKKTFRQFSAICSLDQFKSIVRKVGLIQQNPDKKGVPQGIAISCVLSNAYMLGFDIAVSGHVKSIGGLYRRYCDDIIIVCDKRDYAAVEKFVLDQIAKLKLVIQKEKTDVRLFSVSANREVSCEDEKGNKASLQYLGVVTDGVIATFRGKTIAKFYRRVTGAVQRELVIAKKNKHNKLARKRLNKKFIHSKQRSFTAYAKMGAEVLNSDELQKQFSPDSLSKIIGRKIRKYKK